MDTSTALWPSRLAMGSRSLAAAVGGYALATGLAAVPALGALIPLSGSHTMLAATLLAWLAYAAAIAWAFGARTAWHAWAGLLLPALALAATARWHGGGA